MPRPSSARNISGLLARESAAMASSSSRSAVGSPDAMAEVARAVNAPPLSTGTIPVNKHPAASKPKTPAATAIDLLELMIHRGRSMASEHSSNVCTMAGNSMPSAPSRCTISATSPAMMPTPATGVPLEKSWHTTSATAIGCHGHQPPVEAISREKEYGERRGERGRDTDGECSRIGERHVGCRRLGVGNTECVGRCLHHQSQQTRQRQEAACRPDVEKQIMRRRDLFARSNGSMLQVKRPEVRWPCPEDRPLAQDGERSRPVVEPVLQRFGRFRQDLSIETPRRQNRSTSGRRDH